MTGEQRLALAQNVYVAAERLKMAIARAEAANFEVRLRLIERNMVGAAMSTIVLADVVERIGNPHAMEVKMEAAEADRAGAP